MQQLCLYQTHDPADQAYLSRLNFLKLVDIHGILNLIKELKELEKINRLHLTKVIFRGTQVSIKALEKSGPYRELKLIKGVVVEPIPTDSGIESTIVETSILPKSLGFLDTVSELYKNNPTMLELIKELK